MSRFVTLAIGLLLVIGAFLGFLFWGSIANPAPYRVVVALKDIPPGGEIKFDVLTVDEQIINPRVAQRFILESELSQYLGATAVENIFAGEPLTKLRVVTGDVAKRTKRLALALADERLVAMVIPVSPKSAPQEIVPGDFVNLVWGVGNQTSLNIPEDRPVVTTNQAQRTPTPTPRPDAPAAPDKVVLPVAKTILHRAVVARVNFQQIPNPNYVASGLGSSNTGREAPFLQGSIESLVLLVPRETQEMVAFALHPCPAEGGRAERAAGTYNGTVHVTLWSSRVEPNEVTPLPGVMWSDVLNGILDNRKATGQPALDNMDYLLNLGTGISNTHSLTGTIPMTNTQSTRPAPTPVATKKP